MPVSDELKKLYAEAHEQGLYIKEFGSPDGAMAFCSSTMKLDRAGYTHEKRKKMGLMDANIYMAFGGGETREEAVKEAIDMFKQSESWIPTE